MACETSTASARTAPQYPAVQGHMLFSGVHLKAASRGGMLATSTPPGRAHELIDGSKVAHIAQVKVNADSVVDGGGCRGKACVEFTEKGGCIFKGGWEGGLGEKKGKGVIFGLMTCSSGSGGGRKKWRGSRSRRVIW